MPAFAQYVGQVKKQPKDNQQLRAIAVLEWTGDEGHPKACRLVPVTIYDGEKLNDASLYMSRPEPLALGAEVEYQLKDNGRTTGLFEIKNAGQEQGSWVGYGDWKPTAVAKAAAPKPVIDPAADDDKPVLHRKQHSDETPSADPGASAPTASAGKKSDDDPDRPRLHKPADTSTTASSGKTEEAPDPDQPTLHRHSGSSSDPDTGKKQKKPQDVAHVDNLPQATDPDRPRLQRGKSNADNLKVLPSLMGLPPDMKQAVAISDLQSRPDHPWDYSWANPTDQARLKAQLEDVARAALGLTSPAAPAHPRPAAHRPVSPARQSATSGNDGKSSRPATARDAVQAAPSKVTAQPLAEGHSPDAQSPLDAQSSPDAQSLQDEQFRVFELAYGSGATLVLTASTSAPLAQQKFVTLIAQPDLYGKLNVLFKNVTDGSHLDETPSMRLIDAVDAMADNRGELLFELRGRTQRTFALYRILRGRAEKLFTAGGGEYGSMSE